MTKNKGQAVQTNTNYSTRQRTAPRLHIHLYRLGVLEPLPQALEHLVQGTFGLTKVQGGPTAEGESYRGGQLQGGANCRKPQPLGL